MAKHPRKSKGKEIKPTFLVFCEGESEEATSQECIRQLEGICKGYRKGFICDKLKNKLNTGEEEACKRAKKLTLYNNPSTSVFRLLEEIKKV